MSGSRTTEAEPAAPLIAGNFSVDLGQPLDDAGAGLPAFVAHDRRNGGRKLMAVLTGPDAPARAQAIASLVSSPPPGLLAPVAHGVGPAPGGGTGYFVVCHAPSGAALSSPGSGALQDPARPWTETDLLTHVLRPVATALDGLASRGLTHRAIHPGNLFRNGPGEPVVLGAAWAAPPASRQRALYEPPYSAVCLPAGRGEGAIADDVYALGVTLLVLALGREPLADLSEDGIVQRKLEFGSFQALAGEERLPPMIGDLVRGLLAEDPDHRPPPHLLSNPLAARSRRVAARPPRRAQRALMVGTQAAWSARTLAYALGRDPDQGVRMLRTGVIDQWLRRHLGDAVLAPLLDDFVRQHVVERTGTADGDAFLVMRSIALLDPLAPLCWRGLFLWPDGIGSAIAAADRGQTLLGAPRADAAGDAGAAGRAGGNATGRITELVIAEAPVAWAKMRPSRSDATRVNQEMRLMSGILRQRGWTGGLPRLCYVLNPLMPCRSPLLAGRAVVRGSDLLAALDVAARVPERRVGLPVDREIAAFMMARQERGIEGDLAAVGTMTDPGNAALTALRLFANLQADTGAGPVPNLAAWLVERITASKVQSWRSRRRRAAAEKAVGGLVAAGDLMAVRALIADPSGQAADQAAEAAALEAVRRIDAELAQIAAGAPGRAATARRLGGEIAASLGLAALAGAGVLAAFAP